MNEQDINELNSAIDWWNDLSTKGVSSYLEKHGEAIGYYGDTKDFWDMNTISQQFILDLYRAVKTKN